MSLKNISGLDMICSINMEGYVYEEIMNFANKVKVKLLQWCRLFGPCGL